MGPKKPEMDKPMPMKLPMDPKPCGEDEVEEKSWDNSPDEDYKDTKYMTKDLSGGLNRPKKTYPKVAGGDNPMQATEDKIKEGLKNRLQELMSELEEK